VVQGSGDGSEALGDVRNRPPQLRMPILPFKLNQDRRRYIPRQRHRVTNWPAYDGRGSAWFKTGHFQVTPEIDRALMVKGFLVLDVTLI